MAGVTVAMRSGVTHVNVETAFPHLRLRGKPRYRLTTEQLFLDPSGFPSRTLRDNIAKDAQKVRHRAVYCWDLSRGLTLAALAFHIDEKTTLPLVITDMAIRRDELHAESLFALWMLLDVVQDIALLAPARDDAEIGALAETPSQQAHLESIGLHPCSRPAVLAKSGVWYCYPRTRARS
jgi:hypothetical protein